VEILQANHEQAVGEKLVRWLNARDGTAFAFDRRGGEAPDLVYRDGNNYLHIEVVSAYYDPDHAKWLWGHARARTDTSAKWEGSEFDTGLLRSVETQITKKCLKKYGPDCVLVVSALPSLTSAAELDALLGRLVLPDQIPFRSIFLTGDFPTTSTDAGGYHVWVLYSRSQGRGGESVAHRR
jgi:hypothetical protein